MSGGRSGEDMGVFHIILFYFVYWYQYVFCIYLNYFEDNKCIISLLFHIILMQTESIVPLFLSPLPESQRSHRSVGYRSSFLSWSAGNDARQASGTVYRGRERERERR